MLLAGATWQEVDSLDRDVVVVAPFGAMEQHGPHLPLETDARIAAEIVSRVHREVEGETLMLPVQWAGYSPHHMDFAGSITLSAETFLRMCVELVSSVVKAGFRKFLLLNAHGGNRALLDVAATELKVLHPQATFVSATYWNVARDKLQALRESPAGGMGHACELETSILLATTPCHVKMDLARAEGAWPCSDFFAQDMLGGGVAGWATVFSEFTRGGTNGDPTTASAEKGERFLAAVVEGVVEMIRQYRSGELLKTRPVAVDDRGVSSNL